MSYLQRHFSADNPEFVSLFDELPLWSSLFGKILLDQIPLRKGMCILDLGCGTGFPLLELANRLDPASKLRGIDTRQAFVERANWKASQYHLSNTQAVCGDAAKMPFDDKEFDLVVSNLSLNNFEDRQAVIGECYRVLKRSGRICLTTHLEGHFMEFYSSFEATLRELGLESALPRLKELVQHHGTDETIRELLEEARFSVLKIIRDKFYLRYVNGSALLNHCLTITNFLPGWRRAVPLDSEAQVFSLLERKLNELAEWNGELKITVPALYVEAVK